MRKKKQVTNESRILDINTDMQGTLTFKEPMHLTIQGTFEGFLDTKGYLEIGKKARIKGDIQGEEIVVSGHIEGNIFADKLLRVTATGSVKGDLNVKSLNLDLGAVFEGVCRMNNLENYVPGPDQMSIEDVAQYLNVDSQKVKKWIEDGLLPSENIDNHYIICRSDVDIWVNDQKMRMS